MEKKIGIIIFMLILIILPVVTFICLPKEAEPFSENENRYLEEFPELSLEAIKEETFMDGFSSWFADRFAGRETFISVKNNTELALGKTEISTVATKNDQMLQVLSEYDDIGAPYSDDIVDRNIEIINNFASKYPDADVYFMLVPTSVGIYGKSLLSDTVLNMSVDEQQMIENCYSSLTNVTGVNVFSALYNASDEYIYYRTDHHWTSLGAYMAYSAAGNLLGYEPYALTDYEVTCGSTNFQGTLFSKTLDQSVTHDEIDMYTLKQGNNLTETVSNGIDETNYDSIFFTEFLDVKDKYSTYTGLNAAKVTITNPDAENDKAILIIKDSYANSFIQFIACNYKTVTMVDMRYTNMLLSTLVNVDDYDQVLFLYNCITFADDSDLLKLNLDN